MPSRMPPSQAPQARAGNQKSASAAATVQGERGLLSHAKRGRKTAPKVTLQLHHGPLATRTVCRYF